MAVNPEPKSYFLLLHVVIAVVASDCGSAEYYTGEECCPMCGPGHCVVRHCTEYTSTTCHPCPPSTFMDKPNGYTRCLSCSVCDTSAGLRLKRNCSSTSDTLCEPLEGHYCTDPIKDGCRGAVEHTKCLPGQYIKQPGSASSDTVCEDCGSNTYSDGTFTSCRPHTRCGLMGLHVLTEGSSSHDTECGRRRMHIGVVPVLLLVPVGGVVVFIRIHRKKKRRNKQDKLSASHDTRKPLDCVISHQENAPKSVFEHINGDSDRWQTAL